MAWRSTLTLSGTPYILGNTNLRDISSRLIPNAFRDRIPQIESLISADQGKYEEFRAKTYFLLYKLFQIFARYKQAKAYYKINQGGVNYLELVTNSGTMNVDGQINFKPSVARLLGNGDNYGRERVLKEVNARLARTGHNRIDKPGPAGAVQ